MENKQPSEILKTVINALSLNPKTFADKLGFDRPQVVYDILSGKTKSITIKNVNKIIAAFPNINRNYLLTGEGEPFITIKINADEMATKVSYTESNHDTTQINYNNVIPIYEIEIDAGNVSRLIDDNKNIPIAGHIYLKDSENASGLIGVRAKGDSMATFINGGDTMLIRRLESRTFVPPGNAYVIIGKELSVVKYIRNSADKTKWLLRSHNEFYQDFEVNKEDVVHLFIVVKVLKELTY